MALDDILTLHGLGAGGDVKARINEHGAVFFGAFSVAMGDAAHTLTLDTAGAAETQITGLICFADPESAGASEDLTLPAEADSDGLVLFIFNTGGEGIVIKDDGGGTVATLATTEHAIVACDGTTWQGLVGAET